MDPPAISVTHSVESCLTDDDVETSFKPSHPIAAEIPEPYQHLNVSDDEVEPQNQGWELTVSNALVQRCNALYIPRRIVGEHKMVFRTKVILKDELGNSYNCKIKKAKRRSYREWYLCDGWYQFARQQRLQEGDKLQFVVHQQGHPYHVRVSIARRLMD